MLDFIKKELEQQEKMKRRADILFPSMKIKDSSDNKKKFIGLGKSIFDDEDNDENTVTKDSVSNDKTTPKTEKPKKDYQKTADILYPTMKENPEVELLKQVFNEDDVSQIKNNPDKISTKIDKKEIKPEEQKEIKSKPGEMKVPEKKQGDFTGGAAGIFNKKDKPEINEIAGVKRSEPMNFEKAGGKNVNPNYNPMIKNSYSQNCQSAVAVFEARMRGYDIETSVENQDIIEKLKERPNLAYIDSKTGKTPEFKKVNVISAQECEDFLNNTIKQGERYIFSFKYKGNSSFESNIESAHIIVILKNQNGKLLFYDPQTSKKYNEEYLDLIKFNFAKGKTKVMPKILRIDDKELNYDILNKISKPKKKDKN